MQSSLSSDIVPKAARMSCVFFTMRSPYTLGSRFSRTLQRSSKLLMGSPTGRMIKTCRRERSK